MPKRARYPVFVTGLAITLLGGLWAASANAGSSTLAAIVGVGFVLMLISVAIR